jgi:hypothetical protein
MAKAVIWSFSGTAHASLHSTKHLPKRERAGDTCDGGVAYLQARWSQTTRRLPE